MNWQDDPEIRRQTQEREVRGRVLRSALMWTPIFALAGGALLFFLVDQLVDGGRGSWFLVGVLTIFAFLFGFQSIQSLLDLWGHPRQREGLVTRRWARNDSFVIRTHYVRIDKNLLLRGDVHILDDIKEGDAVSVRYYPHSAVVVQIERIVPPKGPALDARTVALD